MRRDGTDECFVYVEIADSSSVAVVDRHGRRELRIVAWLLDGHVFSLCLPTAHGASQLGHPRRRHKPPINARAIICIALSIRGGIDLEFLGEAIVGWY